MSNNKQSMKLYTEEHLKIFYHLGKIDGFIGRQDDVDELIKNYPPIELPSEEEIREERLLQFPDSEYANRANDRLAFYCGAKFVINKIQGGEQMSNKQNHIGEANKMVSSIDLMFNRAISVLPMGAIDARQRLQETYEQAKAMHKEEIEEAFANGVDDEYEYQINNEPRKNPEHYYNETFGGEQ